MALKRETNRRGAAVIEFGLWVLILVTMVSGIIDFGAFMHQLHVVQRAARDAARVAAASRDVDNATAAAEDYALMVLAGYEVNQVHWTAGPG